MKKKLIIIGIAGVVLVMVALLAVGMSLDKIIKQAVEKAGPTITKVDVTLDRVDLSLFNGEGALNGFSLGNPAGYSSPTSIQVGSASLALQPSSLMADKVVIRHIRLEAPVITLEGSLRGNNLNDLIKGMQSGEDQTAGSASTPEEESADEAASRKLEVDEFSLTGARVNVKIKELGNETKTLVLPDIKMTNLGTGPDGITAAEMSRLILNEVVRKTLQVVMESGGDLNKIGESALEELNKSGNEDAANALQGVMDMFKKEKQ